MWKRILNTTYSAASGQTYERPPASTPVTSPQCSKRAVRLARIFTPRSQYLHEVYLDLALGLDPMNALKQRLAGCSTLFQIHHGGQPCWILFKRPETESIYQLLPAFRCSPRSESRARHKPQGLLMAAKLAGKSKMVPNHSGLRLPSSVFSYH